MKSVFKSCEDGTMYDRDAFLRHAYREHEEVGPSDTVIVRNVNIKNNSEVIKKF